MYEQLQFILGGALMKLCISYDYTKDWQVCVGGAAITWAKLSTWARAGAKEAIPCGKLPAYTTPAWSDSAKLTLTGRDTAQYMAAYMREGRSEFIRGTSLIFPQVGRQFCALARLFSQHGFGRDIRDIHSGGFECIFEYFVELLKTRCLSAEILFDLGGGLQISRIIYCVPESQMVPGYSEMCNPPYCDGQVHIDNAIYFIDRSIPMHAWSREYKLGKKYHRHHGVATCHYYNWHVPYLVSELIAQHGRPVNLTEEAALVLRGRIPHEFTPADYFYLFYRLADNTGGEFDPAYAWARQKVLRLI